MTIIVAKNVNYSFSKIFKYIVNDTKIKEDGK